MASREKPPTGKVKGLSSDAAKRMAKVRSAAKLAKLDEERRLKALDRINIKRHSPDSKKAAASLKELLSPSRERAVRTLVQIMLKSKDDGLRFAVACKILDRTDGPIPKAVEMGGRDGGPIKISDDRPPTLLAILGDQAADILRMSGRIVEAELVEEGTSDE